MTGRKDFFKEYGITIALVVLSIALTPFSGLEPTYIVQELLTRLGRNALLVLALLPMLWAGMGFNFALGAGAMAAQIGLILAVAFNLVELPGLAFAVLAGLPIAVFVGWISGLILNRMKGMEMVISYALVPFLFDGLYRLIMLDLMGSLIPLPSPGILLSRGYGIQNTVKLDGFRQALDNLFAFKVGPFSLPTGTYLIVASMALVLLWIRKHRLGRDLVTVGENPQEAEAAGLSVNRTRMKAVILSMLLACVGQVVFQQNMGAMGTYNAHQQTSHFAVAALMAGGVLFRKVRIRHALIGIAALHLFLMVSPGAGQKVLKQAHAGEYFRQFIGYAIILVGLVRYGMAKHREAEATHKALEASRAPEPALQ